MKLVKIYANYEEFHNIEFNEGFNVILGKVTDQSKLDKSTHNLGKTLLVTLIDFLLLKEINNKHFLRTKVFEGKKFYLELLLNNGKYLIVKRDASSPSKTSFKLNDDKLTDFKLDINWDEEDLAFQKARKKLNEYLHFDILLNWRYRKVINYFLRSQGDYLDVFQLDKFKHGKDRDWKPAVFDLLGFDGEVLVKKAAREDKVTNLEKSIESLKSEADIDTSERDKIQGLIDIKRDEEQRAENKLNRFNFFEKDKEMNHDLVERLDAQIQILNSNRYSLDYEINKINDSLSDKLDSINIDDLKKIYEEVDIYFPKELTRNYEDLLKFNKSITQERNKYLKENLERLKKEKQDINNNLSDLESEKEKLLEYLTEYDSYKKIRSLQRELADIQSDIKLLNHRISILDNASKIEKEILENKHEIEELSEEIKRQIDLKKHTEIRKTYNNIIYSVLGDNALISITQNKYGNVEFNAKLQNVKDHTITAEDDGTSYKKLLCMAFDLSILMHYSNNSFFKFVYHDGALEGLDDRKKILYLKTVKAICKEYNIQYILTLIDSDLPHDQNGKTIHFSKKEICLTLSDRDESEKLFGFSF